MSKRQVIILLGVWIMALSFLGFPASWDTIILVASGLLVAIISYSTSFKSRPTSQAENGGNSNLPFEEHHSLNREENIISGNSQLT